METNGLREKEQLASRGVGVARGATSPKTRRKLSQSLGLPGLQTKPEWSTVGTYKSLFPPHSGPSQTGVLTSDEPPSKPVPSIIKRSTLRCSTSSLLEKEEKQVEFDVIRMG